MSFLRGAGVALVLGVVLAACGEAAPGSNTFPTGGGASTAPPSTPTPSQGGGTANISFSGGVAGTLTQVTTLGCNVTPVNIYISVIGAVGSTNYDLEMEAYAFTGSGVGTYTAGGTPAANAQLGPARQHPLWGATAGTLVLTSKTTGRVSMTLTDASGSTAPVMVSGTWSCASAG